MNYYYGEKPFLTPEKATKEEYAPVKKIVGKYKIKTAIVTWTTPPCAEALTVLDGSPLVLDTFLGKIYCYKNRALVCYLTVGAPVAAMAAEELNYVGIKTVIAFGSAGCIDENFDGKQIVVVRAALSDEGTSAHYLPKSDIIDLDKNLSGKLLDFFNTQNEKAAAAVTWTTDAFYRETQSKIKDAKSKGAVAVEMECSALAAVCKSLKLNFCQFLYFSDYVKNGGWAWDGTSDTRHKAKAKMLSLAIKFAETL
jgi:uridine phosphorylase